MRWFAILRTLWRFSAKAVAPVTSYLLLLSLAWRVTLRRRAPRVQDVFPSLEPFDIPVFVVNLARRSDRRVATVANLHAVGFRDVRVVEAVDGPERHPTLAFGHAANLGCTQSHAGILVDALRSGGPIAICEDDNDFLVPGETVRNLVSEFLGSPDYDLLCLVARVRGPKYPVSQALNAVAWALAPSFYVVKPGARDPLLKAMAKSERVLLRQGRRGPFDQVWRHVQRRKLVFVTPVERIGRQRESYSDIQGAHFMGT